MKVFKKELTIKKEPFSCWDYLWCSIQEFLEDINRDGAGKAVAQQIKILVGEMPLKWICNRHFKDKQIKGMR